mmetsp:Transcript_45216/g.142340  ORF Transcript_45216/g.142340 Transcript_45216/m.142340 type:complete len:90 (-) Transcript_45216:2-271(-)
MVNHTARILGAGAFSSLSNSSLLQVRVANPGWRRVVTALVGDDVHLRPIPDSNTRSCGSKINPNRIAVVGHSSMLVALARSAGNRMKLT